MDDADLQIETIAWNHRTPKLGLVDAEEIHERIGRIEGFRRVRQNAADLREGLHDEDTGHDGARWKVSLKPGLSHGHAFVAEDALAGDDLRHSIDQNERPPMGQNREDAVDLDRGGACFHGLPIGLRPR